MDFKADEIATWTKGWNDRVYNEESVDPDITLGELLLLYFEWMSVHKVTSYAFVASCCPPRGMNEYLLLVQVTDACAKAVYELLLLVLPRDTNAGSWAVSKKLLKKVCESRVVEIQTCPNDCIAFIDCKHPKLAHYQHSHRECCPTCGADRWLYREDGKKRAAKTVYHLPVGPWLRDLFRDDDIAPYLASDYEDQPKGHVTKSRGWNAKVHAYVSCAVLRVQNKIVVSHMKYPYKLLCICLNILTIHVCT
jgi:hypothetical protein